LKPSILIVDDEKTICNGLSRLFADDYITYEAYNACEALDILTKVRDIDIMLCDIKMPGMRGDELIERVRKSNEDLFIILITAASPIIICDAMKKGANSYMRKPLDIELLEKTLMQAVRSKGSAVKGCQPAAVSR